MIDYHGKNITIIGLGLTGLFCVNFFLMRGVIPRVIDTRNAPPELNRLPKYIEYHLGSLNFNWLFTSDLIIISPGIALTNPIFSIVANTGIEIIGDIELFCREVQAPIIAITGSNGKSTVATLVGEMAKAANINVGIGGNIGLPAIALLLDPSYQLYILELSSFQLETTFSLKTIAATILNITEDHMDRYPFGLKQYHSIKHRIYKNAQTCVINTDDILTIPTYSADKHYISFGVNTGDYHLFCCKNNVWLCIKGEKVLNVKELSFFGKHNYINALAALALASTANLPLMSNIKALTNFTGLAHRFQLVLERNGVRWINDSKSTNIGSTKAALNSLCIEGTIHLLLGGDGKSANFSLLKPLLTGDKIRLYCFGRDRDKLAALRPEISVQTETLEEAMRLLSSRVKPGDTALLSPACASFDQFINFEQRGDTFTKLAKELG